MALDRTALGSPSQGLVSYIKPSTDNTAGALSSIASLGKAAYVEYHKQDSLNKERLAKRDIINKTINPDLDQNSGVYHEMVVKAELSDRFNSYKDDLTAGKYSDIPPEEFQKTLQKGYAEELQAISNTKYPGIYSEIQSTFWLEKEGTLVAAQRGYYNQRMKEGQSILYAKTLGESLTPNLPKEEMQKVFDSVFHSSAGTLGIDTQLNTAITVASQHALAGSDTLLNILEEKYSISNVPAYSAHYNAAKKSFVAAKRQQDAAYIVDQRSLYAGLAEEGTFTDVHVKEALNNPRLSGSVSIDWLTGLRVRSNKQNLVKRNLDNAYIRFEAGHDIGYLPAKDRDTIFSETIKKISDSGGTPEEQGLKLGFYLKNQTFSPDSLKTAAKSFVITDPIDDDGNVNPTLKETFEYFQGLEKSPGMGKGQVHNLMDEKQLLAYTTIKSYMSSTQGSEEQRYTFAAKKLDDIQKMSGLIDPNTIKLDYKIINDQVEDKLKSPNFIDMFGETNIDSAFKRNAYRASILNVAKAEVRRGVDPTTAVEYATALQDKNWEHAFGQIQMTGGVNLDTRCGFTQKGKAEDAYTFMVTQDPTTKSMLEDIYGKGYNYKDLSTVYMDGYIQIGGDTEKALTISLETMSQRYKNYIEEQENTKAAPKADPGPYVRFQDRVPLNMHLESVRNDEFATTISRATEGDPAFVKTKKELSKIEMDIDKYLSQSPGDQIIIRKAVQNNVARLTFNMPEDTTKGADKVSYTSYINIPENTDGKVDITLMTLLADKLRGLGESSDDIAKAMVAKGWEQSSVDSILMRGGTSLFIKEGSNE